MINNVGRGLAPAAKGVNVMLHQLEERYGRYVEESNKVRSEAKFGAGFLGFGNDPRKDPCHVAFYKDVEQWVKDFLAGAPCQEDVFQAAKLIVEAPAQHRDEDAYWFMYAAHGLCRDLIPLLNVDQRAELLEIYDREYPKRDRLAVQKEIYKLLSKK